MSNKNKLSIALSLLILISATAVEAGSFSLSNSTAGLFDASSGTRSVNVTGAESGYDSGIVTDVDISINFAKADGESFDTPFPGGTPFFNEIVFILMHGSTQINLIAANSWVTGSGQFDGTITFDQSALNLVNFAAAPQAGSFRPVLSGDLNDYNGLSANGQWDLFIQDTTGQDALRFRSFDLNINTRGANVPEPGTLALLGVGLLGAFSRRKAA